MELTEDNNNVVKAIYIDNPEDNEKLLLMY